MPTRKPLVRNRDSAFALQRGCCYYCGLPMWQCDPEAFASSHRLTLKQARLLRCTAEHVLPRCDGGTHERANIVAACWCCNTRRHARRRPMDSQRYRAFVRRRVARGGWHPVRLLA